MSVLRYALPALAVAQSAMAATCSVSATTTLQNYGDATALASCTTFSGSIALATSISGDISLSGIQKLDGNLVSEDASGLTSLTAANLQSITGTFSLDNVTSLGSLSFAKLTSVDTIKWINLPSLQTLSFTSGLETAEVVDIENTQLNSLDGINLTTVGQFTLANNRFLNKVEAQLSNITTGLSFGANGGSLEIAFPNLVSAKNLTIIKATSLSLPSLKSVDGSLGLYSNSLESFAAPNLTSVGGALAIVNNTKLANISFPALTTVTANLQVANNTELSQIDFPALQSVGGSLDCYGNFTEFSADKLTNVKGAFNLQSSSNIDSTCDHFSDMHGSSKEIKGKYTCVGLQEKPGDASTTPTSTGTGAKATKSSAANHMDVSSSAVMGFTGVLAAIFGLL